MAAEVLFALSVCGVAGLISLASARLRKKNAPAAAGERGLESLLPGDVLDTPSGTLLLGRALRIGASGRPLLIYYFEHFKHFEHLEPVRGETAAKSTAERSAPGWLLGVGLSGLVSGEAAAWLLEKTAAPSLPLRELTVETAPSELHHQGLRHRLSGRLRARARVESLHAASEQAVQLVSYHGPGGSRLLLVWTGAGGAEFFAGTVIAETALRIFLGPGPGKGPIPSAKR